MPAKEWPALSSPRPDDRTANRVPAGTLSSHASQGIVRISSSVASTGTTRPSGTGMPACFRRAQLYALPPIEAASAGTTWSSDLNVATSHINMSGSLQVVSSISRRVPPLESPSAARKASPAPDRFPVGRRHAAGSIGGMSASCARQGLPRDGAGADERREDTRISKAFGDPHATLGCSGFQTDLLESGIDLVRHALP